MQQEASDHAKEDHDVVIVRLYPKDSSIRPKGVGSDRDEENLSTLIDDKRENMTNVGDKRDNMASIDNKRDNVSCNLVARSNMLDSWV